LRDCLQACPERSEQVAAWERQLNALVYKVYGLTNEEIAIVEGALDRE